MIQTLKLFVQYLVTPNYIFPVSSAINLVNYTLKQIIENSFHEIHLVQVAISAHGSQSC